MIPIPLLDDPLFFCYTVIYPNNETRYTMPRRILSLFLSLMTLLSSGIALASKLPTYPPIPDLLTVSLKEKVIRQDNGSTLSVFYPTTAHDAVTEELRGIINSYADSIAPTLSKGKKAPENSRLDIRCIYSLTGESWLSFTILARTVFHRQTQAEEITTRVYDMASGRQISLSDIFPEDSPAWAMMADAVKTQLSAYFPNEAADEKALAALCQRETLEKASFSMDPVKMELLYPARLVYPGRATLMRVKVYYRALADMMTSEAARQTDNSRYPLFALTYDDGPSHSKTTELLDVLQAYGAKATFFLVGKALVNQKDVVQREHDEGHAIASHTWTHPDPANISVEEIFEEKSMFEAALGDITGTSVPYLRAPGGRYQKYVKNSIGLPLIQWSILVGDGDWKGASRIAQAVAGNARHGGIVLLHDSRNATIQAAEQMLSSLRKKGFVCVSVDDLFMHQGIDLQPNVVYRDANGWIETDGL